MVSVSCAWVARHSAEEYALPPGWFGQILLQGARACLCASEVAVGALRYYVVRHRIYRKGPSDALCVLRDDGGEVR